MKLEANELIEWRISICFSTSQEAKVAAIQITSIGLLLHDCWWIFVVFLYLRSISNGFIQAWDEPDASKTLYYPETTLSVEVVLLSTVWFSWTEITQDGLSSEDPPCRSWLKCFTKSCVHTGGRCKRNYRCYEFFKAWPKAQEWLSCGYRLVWFTWFQRLLLTAPPVAPTCGLHPSTLSGSKHVRFTAWQKRND